MEKVENSAKQGEGTSFGVLALYGSKETFVAIEARYQELLPVREWEGFVRPPSGAPWYCHPDYDAVVLLLSEHTAAFKDSHARGIIASTETAYETLYVIGVTRFPFDETGECPATE